MAEKGTVNETSIGENRDSDAKVRLVKSWISTEQDVQTLQLAGSIDHGLVEGSTVLVLEIGSSWKIAIPLEDGLDPTASDGEKYLYSQDPSTKAIKASFKLKADGTININGDVDTAVGFTDLKAGFDQLKTELDTNLTAIAAAITPMATGFNIAPTGTPMLSLGPGGVVPYVKTPLTASVDNSEKDTVKLP